ncbi:PepSY domain-containing protein [Henriciella barbarensis]|uniref:PepSY domain-containing protein n=1 Tax=Henriciella barbarensis TaxID=86342 RepID=A0A399R7Z9_9PROT|nr:PepSY-associated TM helix domain-containing protein [Henriciella barbarensis]RIJ25802.1 PepSY domain-containing protein [Henriciella barbarensis]
MATSIWPKSSKARVDRSLSAHSVMGLVISALMFIVCLSGTVAMFEDEIGWWENPVQAPVETVSPDVAQAAANNVFETQPDTTHLYLYLPRDNWQRFVVGGDDGLETANAQGAMTGGYDTAWNDFLVHLHYYLSLPTSFGMIVVAILGVMLVAMAVSGLLAHPRIFRDAFRLRTKGQARLVQADLHNRLSVWTAPFTIAIALTGAMIGLFVVVAMVLAQTSFDGNPRALTESIFGAEGEIDESPAPLADVRAAMIMLEEMAPEANPFLAIVHDPGTASQHTTIYGEHTDRLVYGEMYEFDADGTYTGKADYTDGEAGKQIAMSTYRLHFGDFGGLAMKAAYFLMGVGLCIVVAAGLNIYFLKRAEAGRGMPRLEAAWAALVWGSPALLAATLTVSLLGISMVTLTGLFWLGAVALCGLGLVLRDQVKTSRWMRFGLGVSLFAAVGVHAVRFTGSYQWAHVWSVSLCFMIAGMLLMVWPILSERTSTPASVVAARP